MGNLLHHAERVSALDKGFGQDRIQLTSEIHSEAIFPLVGSHGSMSQSWITVARNAGRKEGSNHQKFPAHVIANIEPDILKTTVIAPIVNGNYGFRLAANQQVRL